MKMNKWLTALVLALVLCLSVSVALAVNSEAALKTACETSGTVTLTDDVALTKSIKIPNGISVTLDLNGYRLTGPDDGNAHYYAFIVEEGGQLTLEDNSAAQTGVLWAKCYGIETKGGTFIMNSGKIDATNNKTLGAAIVNYGGNVIVYGGSMVASQWAVNSQSYFASTTLKVLGGTLESKFNEEDGAITIGGEHSKESDTAQLMGGTVKGKIAVVNNTAAANVTVSGGFYSTKPENVTIAGDMQLVNGMYQIVPAPSYSAPKTGDNSSVALWVSLMAISAAAFVALGRKSRFN